MNKVKGTAYTIYSSVAFGIMPFLTKFAYDGGANAVTTLMFRFLIAGLILYVFLKFKKISLKISGHNFVEILFYGAFLYALNTVFLYEAYNYIPTGIATTLHFIYPVTVTLLMISIFNENLGINKVLALIFSFLGMYCLLGGNCTGFDIYGVLLAAGSGLVYAGYIVSAGKCKYSKIDSYVTIFYLSILSSVLLFIYGLFTNNLTLNMAFSSYASIGIISIFCTVLALIAFLEGIKLIGPSNTAILSTLEPIVSIILGILLLNEVLSFKIGLGSILVLISVIIVTIEKSKVSDTVKN
ncbi:DMT family transporter [Methanococcus maripaludis]|uniref:Threonine/homoserine exporter RhtA n=1 Tax=Methanococcus maripaludis TaxID=39152 RepID=A0A2L1C9H2_METMI|nr:DMT family transporter [Methanococcus maripaludis]AVB75850.1 Threonine/homoserine exporter RhtA [Methanococcus maripaludis]